MTALTFKNSTSQAQVISKERIVEVTEKFSNMGEIMVVGDIGLDKYTFGDVKRISPEAPVPVLEVQREWTKLGLAANISDNLKALGVRSLLCGVIGQDIHGNVLEELIEDMDLSTWGLVRDEGRPTIYKERVTTSTQQICRIDYEDSSELAADVESRLIERFDEFASNYNAFILEDYAKGTLSEGICQKVIQYAKAHNKIITVDPGVSTNALFYRGATLLKPNLKEAKIICESLGHKNKVNDIAGMLEIFISELDLEMAVITLGGDGMALMQKGKSPSFIPTAANEVFDVSGAGDTAIALLTSALLAGASLEEAAWIGNCGAGVVVAKKGTSTVNLHELLSFHEKLKQNL